MGFNQKKANRCCDLPDPGWIVSHLFLFARYEKKKKLRFKSRVDLEFVNICPAGCTVWERFDISKLLSLKKIPAIEDCSNLSFHNLQKKKEENAIMPTARDTGGPLFSGSPYYTCLFSAQFPASSHGLCILSSKAVKIIIVHQYHVDFPQALPASNLISDQNLK